MKEKLTELLKLLKNKKVLIGICIFLVIILFLIFLFSITHKVTKLERVKITEFNNNVSYYLDEVIEHDGEGKYLNFAIEYIHDKENKDEFETKELIDVINNNFSLNYNEEGLSKLGISELVAGKGIVYDVSKNVYKYDNKETIGDIANKKIITYDIKSIKKISGSKFRVKYNRLVVENPYKILNYYNDQNIELAEDNKTDLIDVTDITNYVKGVGKVSNVKKLINNETIDNFGSIDGTATITFVIKEDKLLIDSIKK